MIKNHSLLYVLFLWGALLSLQILELKCCWKNQIPQGKPKKKVPTLVEPLPLNFGYKVGFFVLDFNQLKHLKRKVLKSIYIRMSFRKVTKNE